MFFFFKKINFIYRPETLIKTLKGIDARPVIRVVPVFIKPPKILLNELVIELNSVPKPNGSVEFWHKTSGAEKPINRVSNKSFILFSNFIFNAFSNYN